MAQNDQALNIWLIHVVNPMPYKHIYIIIYVYSNYQYHLGGWFLQISIYINSDGTVLNMN